MMGRDISANLRSVIATERAAGGVSVVTSSAVGSAERTRRRMLALTLAVDLLAVTVSPGLATLIRWGHEPFLTGEFYGRWPLLWVPVAIGAFFVVRLYDPHRYDNPVEELRTTFHGVSLAMLVVVIASFSVQYELSRLWIILTFTITLAMVNVGRHILRKSIHAARRNGHLRQAALIVGADETAMNLAHSVEDAHWTGLDVVGFVQVDGRPSPHFAGAVVGGVDRLAELVRRFDVSEVLIAPSVVGDGAVGSVIAALDGLPVHLRLAPGLEGFHASKLSIRPLGHEPLLTVERTELEWGGRVLKRSVDVAGAVILGLFALPILAVCGVAIKLDSRGPAFFRQRRVGARGQPFTVWKLRTMIEEAEAQREALRAENEAGGVLFKIRQDPRLTRVGRILRRFSLDELPQLWNVLRGDMSLVGPRPLPIEDYQLDEDEVALVRRLKMRPGITGLWQVNGRGDSGLAEFLRLDIVYVQNWSLALDLYVLARTLPAALLGRGAY